MIEKKINLYFIRSNYNIIIAKLCQSLVEQNKKLLINTSSKEENKKLDKYLWSFKDDAFVPHRTLDDLEYPEEKIILFYGDYTRYEKLKSFDIIFFSPNVRVKNFNLFNHFFLFSAFKENVNYETHKINLEKIGFKTKILIEDNNKKWQIF